MNFAEVVFQFYPIDTLRQHLSKSEDLGESDIIFQDAVATLLSLSGCSVVTLGKKGYETLRARKTRYELGSVDLIAYYREKDRLCLIDCTSAVVDDSKIRRLQQTVREVSTKEERICSRVFGLIPSSRDCPDIKYQYYEDIHIVDRVDLEKILEFIDKGKLEDARRKFFF